MATTQQEQTRDSQTGRTGMARDVAAFHTPLHATREGNPVTVLAIGDVEGKSPAYLCCDQQGNSQWESVSRIRIIDPHALPLSEEAVRNITQRSR